MKHDLLLLSRGGLRTLSIRWDEDAGTFTRRDAARALELVESAAQAGCVQIHPIPSSHKLSAEPMKSRTDLAAIFEPYYILPPLFAEAMPAAPSDDEDEGDDDGLQRVY
jgi:hypothetical protein